jgi:phospholipid/cholesterol/gamma-HCH transport system substrate-binding protein
METDRHYFFEGLFIIVLALGAAFAFVWLSGSGHRDDVLYRIRFDESVSGLSLGDPVKFRGVDVGTVKAMRLDPGDPKLVQVDVALRKDAPVKTDTRASLKLKGITGVLFIELNGGSAGARTLVNATPEGSVPEIASEKSPLTTALEALPKAIDRFVALESQTNKVLSDVGAATREIKENPSSLLFGKSKSATANEGTPPTKERASAKRQGKG